MGTRDLEGFFERLLAEGGPGEDPPVSARNRAALAAGLAHARPHGAQAHDGGDIRDLESGECFIADAADLKHSLPPELLASAIAQAQAETTRPVRAVPSNRTLAWGARWTWAGSAAAAVLSLIIVGERIGREPALPRFELPPPWIVSEPQLADATLDSSSARAPEPPAPPVQQQLAQADPPRTASPSVPRAPAAVAAKPLIAPEQVRVTATPARGAPLIGVSIASLEPPQVQDQRGASVTASPVKETGREPVSTFSAEVDTTSYGDVRRFLANGDMPPARAVRVDEMINYFDYHYAAPQNRSAPFEPTVAVYRTPWNADTQILHIGVKGFELPKSEQPNGTPAIAKDVKLQVEFNPDKIAQYRLIGYETHGTQNRDFISNKVENGEIGSGYTVTALYEITPVGSKSLPIDHLHSGLTRPSYGSMTDELATLRIVYKLPAEDRSRTITRMIGNRDVARDFAKLPADLRFAAAVAGAGQLLRHDPYIKSFDYGRVLAIAENAKGDDQFGYRGEFIGLIRRLQGIARATIAEATHGADPGAREPTVIAANPPKAMGRHQIAFDDYPSTSRRLGEQGMVKVKYLVEADGSVGDCAVMTSSGSQRLDDAACVLVKRWMFKPATVTDGTSVAMWLDADIAFELR